MPKSESILRTVSDDYCTGCAACELVCPLGAITMTVDDEGFIAPFVNSEKCVGCGRCLKTCHSQDYKGNSSFSGYAMLSRSDQRTASSSGGVFFELANSVLSSGGIVYGASFDDALHLRHCRASSFNELTKMQGSKYIQSDTRGVFVQVEQDLVDGRTVLFSGTPCQVAGLKKYLKADYDNLFCLDLVCHGVPSPGIWKNYVEYLGIILGEPVKKVSFRIKSKFDKSSFALIVSTDNTVFRREANDDLFYTFFLQGLIFRESCYSCKYATINNRPADITIGDCASCGNYQSLPQYEALSTVLINTVKGESLLSRYGANLDRACLDIPLETMMNRQLNTPFARPAGRDRVFYEIYQEGFSFLEIKYLNRMSIWASLFSRLKRIVPIKTRVAMKRVLRSLCGR